MASNPYGLKEGAIEQHVDYTPEALGATEMEAGEPEQTWDDYCIELVPIEINGQDTGKRAIMRNGNFLSMVSEQYRLLPNERAVGVADMVADDLGAVPFHEFDGDWYIQLDDHVFQDEEGRRAHALYAWDDPVDLGYGDEVQLGFAVHNSIDASMSFRVGLFTFRHACANMVFMGVDRSGMGFDERNVLQHMEQRHTAGLDIENLKAVIQDTVQFGPDVIEAYRSWMDSTIDATQVEDLIRRAQRRYLSQRNDLPDWLSQAMDALEQAEERARENDQLVGDQFVNGLPQQARAQIIEANVPSSTTVWDAYNDLTQNIWHSDKTNDQSKMGKFRNVHRAAPFQITAGEDDSVTIV